MIDADDSAANAVARFEDGDNEFGVDVSVDVELMHDHTMRIQVSQPVAPAATLQTLHFTANNV